MYKAIKDIGGYKIGDIVPDEKAIVWIRMYKEPHVEELSEEEQEENICKENDLSESDDKIEVTEETKEDSSRDDTGDILEDYLARNKGVVIKNISEDKLNTEQLKLLLDLEKKGKNRPIVIRAINKKLNE